MIIGLLTQFAQAGQIRPVLLLHVDIQQHQIDADAGIGQQDARLAQSGDRRLASETADLAPGSILFSSATIGSSSTISTLIMGSSLGLIGIVLEKIGSARPVRI